jgi:hypothetical protein
MMRRPTRTEGAMVPHFTLAMVALTALGVGAVAWDKTPALTELGYWAVAAGVVGVVTAGLLFWRLMHGALIAAPLWVLLAGAVGLRVGAPGGSAGWVIAGGVLLLVTLALVAVNRPVGAGLSLALWLSYAGFVLRALPDTVAVSAR